jgi:GTP-binding protein HflX
MATIEPPALADLNRAMVVLPLVGAPQRAADARLAEACGLAQALDVTVVAREIVRLRQVHPNAYLGGGRVDAVRAQMEDTGAGLLVMDAALTPVQQRNLERALNAKVIDREGLILEIFGRRARTKEGKLQVELARLGYERSRLVRTWTHLERQRGGLGKTGGPGETQLEIDRRLIDKQIDRLKLDLEEVRRTRGLQRTARKRAGMATVVLVGYTNAGKSSLFNRLTAAGVLAKDMPFATLDPTARLVTLPGAARAIFSDTVGFIADLPTDLIAAFRATLEEAADADVLIHVRDISHPESDAQADDVYAVLDQVLKDAPKRAPIVEAWNKIDLVASDRAAGLTRRAASRATERAQASVAMSATGGQGVQDLLRAVERLAFGAPRRLRFKVSAADGRARARIAAAGRIVREDLNEDSGELTIVADINETAARAIEVPYEEGEDIPIAAE